MAHKLTIDEMIKTSMNDNNNSLVKSFDKFVKVACQYVERSKTYEKELNLLRDEVVGKRKKLHELQVKISIFETNESNANVNGQDHLNDARKISNLETCKAQMENELLQVRYENARLKSEKEHLERSLILSKSLYERELQKCRRQNLESEQEGGSHH